MKKYIKEVLKSYLKKRGKRLTNYYAPAKPYADGVAFLKEVIKKPDWIIDIGVADGTPDLTSSFPMDQYKYLLVEANPNFSPYLEDVRKKYSENIVVEECFCGENEETILFHINKTGHTASRYSSHGLKESIEVKVKRLDTIIEEHSITGSLFLKIDVEGAELDVLKGAVNTLTICDVVILEAWINTSVDTPSDFASLVSFMKENSFVVFDFFGGHSYQNGILQHVDIVFAKENSSYCHLR